MHLFQICGNFCFSWILFSPPLKQVQFLPIPSTGQKTQVSWWLQWAVQQSTQWLSSASVSPGVFPPLRDDFHYFHRNSNPLWNQFKTLRLKVLLEEIYWEHRRKRIKERKGRWSTWITHSLRYYTQFLLRYSTNSWQKSNSAIIQHPNFSPPLLLVSRQLEALCSILLIEPGLKFKKWQKIEDVLAGENSIEIISLTSIVLITLEDPSENLANIFKFMLC